MSSFYESWLPLDFDDNFYFIKSISFALYILPAHLVILVFWCSVFALSPAGCLLFFLFDGTKKIRSFWQISRCYFRFFFHLETFLGDDIHKVWDDVRVLYVTSACYFWRKLFLVAMSCFAPLNCLLQLSLLWMTSWWSHVTVSRFPKIQNTWVRGQ